MVSGQLNIVMPTDWSNGAINYHIPPYFTKGSYPIMVWAITDDGVRLSNLVTLEVGDSTTVVVTPIVTAESITDPFLYSVSPHVAVGGSIMTIQGSNFGDSPNTSVINFGGFALSNPLSWSDNEISFKIPDNAAQGDYPIQVMKRKISGAQVLESASNSLQMTVRVFSTAARTYPNPFDPNQGPIILEIVTTLAGMGNVEIYDLTGRKIWALTANLNSGVNNLSWDGRDYSGNIVSDGIYLLRVVNGSQLVAKAKILVVKR